MSDSRDKENKFTFDCPISKETERFVVCSHRKTQKWMGRRIGSSLCACAMDAGKCPVVEMHKVESRSGRQNVFFDAVGKISSIPRDILAKINRCFATPTMIGSYPDLSLAEKTTLTSTDLSDAPVREKSKGSSRGKRKVDPGSASSSLETATGSGDMADMLNDAISKEENNG